MFDHCKPWQKGRTDLQKQFSELHVYTYSCIHTYSNTHTHTIKVINNDKSSLLLHTMETKEHLLFKWSYWNWFNILNMCDRLRTQYTLCLTFIIVDVLLRTLLLVCSRVNIVCDFGKTITFEMFFFRYLSPLNLKDKGMWSKLLLLAQLQCTVQFLPLCSFFLFLLSWDTFSLINWFSQKIKISPPILLFFQPLPSSHHPSPPPAPEKCKLRSS